MFWSTFSWLGRLTRSSALLTYSLLPWWQSFYHFYQLNQIQMIKIQIDSSSLWHLILILVFFVEGPWLTSFWLFSNFLLLKTLAFANFPSCQCCKKCFICCTKLSIHLPCTQISSCSCYYVSFVVDVSLVHVSSNETKIILNGFKICQF